MTATAYAEYISTMDYRVLGPLEVHDRDGRCEIGGPRQRAVLGVLLAASGRAVAVDAILQAVYGDEASPSLRRSLQTFVSNLRHALGGAVIGHGDAYRLDLDGATVDAAAFEAAVARARDVTPDDPALASRTLREALAMWRGPPYADVEAHGHLDGEIARCSEMRLDALEARFEADLAIGRHREIVAEAAGLAAEHPWRERLRSLHIVALYRSGRQTEALRAFEETRRALTDDLGVEPSAELRELEHRILVHDPTLLVEAPTSRGDTARSAPDPPADTAPPAGWLTFVYTDIEGSTRLLRELGDTYDELIHRHHRIARAAWARHRGTEVASEGDGFVVAFAEADDALAATVDVQREIHGAAWPGTRPVRVRIGVHSGFARIGPTGYSALALHQAARVVGAAHGDQILLTAETVARIDRPSEVELVSVGRFRVRDFDEPVELFTVRASGLPVRDTAPRVPPAERHNIIRPTTPLVDRVDERQRLVADLAPGRLVTLVGPGGVGKTRLATEVALTVPDEWPDGVWFVELAPVRRGELVDAAVASVLGVADSAATHWRDGVLGHLAPRRLLLVLDNCEHLPSAVAELVDAVLSRCEHIGVLTTSRAPLGIRSERVHRIGPLAISDRPDDATRTGRGGGPAIELFEARAGPIPAAHLGDVIELCRELDGLPLAIELAAARARTVPPGELVARLRRFPASRATAFASSDPGLPERHRSLAEVLDWSVERLDLDERAVLRRLTVFVSGFDLDAALSVCATPGLADSDVADHLWSLVDGSLVEIDPGAGETRYRLLTTVRAHLEAGADDAELRDARMRLARHLRRELGPERELDLRWIHRMEIEIDNVRAVVDHPATPVDVAQALAWSVGKFHDVTDDFQTGITELGRWVEQLATDGPEMVAMLTLLADLHLRLAELDAAGRLLERAEDVATTTGSADWDSAGLTRARADLAIRLGDTAGAIDLLEADLRHRHPPRAAARLWDTLGIARGLAGDARGAIAALESELAAATASGTEALLATTHGNLAEANLQLGDRRAAAHHQLISLELARAYRHPVEVAFSMMIAARLIASPERYGDAVRLQVVADELLAEASYELYPDDHGPRAELLDAARVALGPQEFDRIAEEARAIDPDDAAELAARVLADISTPVAASTTTADPDPRA